jgi:outer membrane protein assembly factor BamD
MHHPGFWRRACAAGCALVLLAAVAGCAAKNSKTPPDPSLADQFLMERGRQAMQKKRWIDAREYFRQVVDNYPGSPLRPAAKLAIADSYLGEGSTESLVLSANEYREFLTFYPTDPKADYAQYSIAMTHFKQMRAADRDLTPTKEALQEFDVFFQRYPMSPLAPEARQQWRIARDRLSEGSYKVGVSYFKRRWYPGAIDRFNEVIREDPGFSHLDAVYFYLAESLARSDRKGEAIPFFDLVVKQDTTSDLVKEAQKRLKELTAQ